MEARYFYISVEWATFRIEAVDNVVSFAAPIAKWMQGRELKSLRKWCKKHHATVVELTQYVADQISFEERIIRPNETIAFCRVCGRADPIKKGKRDGFRICEKCLEPKQY